MCKYGLDDMARGGRHQRYDIPKPTAEPLAAVPHHHIDFVSQNYHRRNIYRTAVTVTASVWQTLPLNVKRFICITLHITAEVFSFHYGFWKLTLR